MTITTKMFVFPSVVMHGALAVLFLILAARVAIMKPPVTMVKVSLVQSAPKMTAVASAPAPKQESAQQPQAAPKSEPKPEPKPVAEPPKAEPKPEPKAETKPKPEPKPKPQPKPIKPDERKVIPTPKDVLEKQKQWQDDRKKKKDQASKAATNRPPTVVAYKPPPRPNPVTHAPIQPDKTFEEAQQRLEAYSNKLAAERKAMSDRIKANTVGGVAIGNSSQGTVFGTDRPTTGQAGGIASGSSSQGTTGAGGMTAGQAGAINDYIVGPMYQAIAAMWNQIKPANLPSARCEVSFTVSRNGQVSNVKLEKPSPQPELNKAALKAVSEAKFPAFPANMTMSSQEFLVPFELTQ